MNVRKSLLEGSNEDTKYRCIGAVEIEFRIHELGYSEDETPSLSTIITHHQKERPDSPKEEAIYQMQV